MIRTAVATRTQQITQNALSRDVVAGPVSRVPAGSAIPLARRKHIDQRNGNLPYLLRKRTARTGEPQEQSGQLLDRISLGQTREATSFVPGIEVQAE